jgi:hypothetical protein
MAFFRRRENALQLIKFVQTFQKPIVSINCQFPKHANLYLNDQSFFTTKSSVGIQLSKSNWLKAKIHPNYFSGVHPKN